MGNAISGAGGRSCAGYDGYAELGDDGIAEVHTGGYIIVGDRGRAYVDNHGFAQAGEGGRLMVVRMGGDQVRCYLVGKDNIKPDTLYEIGIQMSPVECLDLKQVKAYKYRY